MFIFLLSSLTAIVVSFLCSLAEAVLLSLNSVKIETDKGKGLRYAIILDKLKSNINRPISAILILNTIAHTGGATIAGSSFDDIYGNEYIWVFSVIFTFVILFGTEILPKVIGVTYSLSLSKYIAIPLQITIKILYPLILIAELFHKAIVRKKSNSAQYTLEDIRTIAKVAHRENIINNEQEDIIVRTAQLRNKKISDIMLPISNVVFFQQDIGVEECFKLAEQYLHTRYPVSQTDSPQNIIGYLNFKEIALHIDEIKNDNLHTFIRPVLFVKSTNNILYVLKQLNMKHYHLAIVKNQAGVNIGMVTLEDIVEEIVGEIADEFDTVEEEMNKAGVMIVNHEIIDTSTARPFNDSPSQLPTIE